MKKNVKIALAAVFFMAALSCVQQRDTSLERSTPEAEGVSSRAIVNFFEKIAEENLELHSFMLVKNGKVISEQWLAPYAPHIRHNLYSISKSFTSIAVGMAVDEGLLTADTLLSGIFTDEFAQLESSIDERALRLSIRHLLTMSTGMDRDYWGENNIFSFLTGTFVDEPGTEFRYSSMATYMLSAALTRVTGQTLADYLKPRLFDPLGIDYNWEFDETTGVHTGGWGLAVTTECIAKFGYMLLNKGMWEGRRLVSEEWIREATSWQISNGDGDGDWASGYGYQFWVCQPEGVFRGDGASGQLCVVVPSAGIVIAITANIHNMQLLLDLLWEMLEDIETLPANGGGVTELASFSNMTLLTIDDEGEPFPRFAAKYEIADAGEWLFFRPAAVSFDFNDDQCVMSLFTEHGNDPHSSFLITNRQWEFAEAPYYSSAQYNRVAANGVWKDNVFTAAIWYYETALRMLYRFTFSEDLAEVAVERSFDALNPLQFIGTGRRID